MPSRSSSRGEDAHAWARLLKWRHATTVSSELVAFRANWPPVGAAGGSVTVAVVHVGRVRVRVLHPFVRVGMAVRLDPTVLMRMPVVLIVDVQVLVLDRVVHVLVCVLFPQQEQDAARHERRRNRVAKREPL